MNERQVPPGGSVTHAVNVMSDDLAAIVEGRKRFVLQPSARGYEVGDLLRLMEWSSDYDAFTRAWVMVQVTHLLRGPAPGVSDGYCIMSISPVLVNWRDDQRLISASNS